MKEHLRRKELIKLKLGHIKKYVIGTIAGVAVLTAGVAVSQAYADEKQSDRILDNIYIGEVAVGGMSEDEARQAVTEYVDSVQDTAITLNVSSKSVEASAGELGLEWENVGVVEEALAIGKSGSLITRYKDKKDLEHEPKELPLVFGTDESTIKSYLKKNEDQFNQEAVDGGLTRENGAFQITGGDEGIAVDVAESVKVIADYISNDWDKQEAEIELSADVVEPRGSKEELSKVKDVLGKFSTNYSSSSAGRAMNVSNGCSLINGALLYPGDEFSVYEAVSPFDAEHGYALAGSYENGTVVETYGGGICQVSTTLYNAVIRAELEVTERFAHSMIVTYVEPSMDAAIAGTYKDLKFKNNTDAPIYIEGITSGGIISFTIYGQETRDPNREVVFESEIISVNTPKTQIQGSASHNVGYVSVQQSAHVGKVAKLWKVVKVNGVEQSREEFNNSNYSASPKIIVVGTNTSSEAARAYIQNAIAAQDEGSIYAAAAQAANIAAQPQQPEEPEENPDDPDEEKPDSNKDNKDKDNKDKDNKDNQDSKTDKNNSKDDNKDKDKTQTGTISSDSGGDKKEDTNANESSGTQGEGSLDE